MAHPLLIHPPPFAMADPDAYANVADVVPMGLVYVAEACRRAGYDPLVVLLHDAAAVMSRMEGGSEWTEPRWTSLVARLLADLSPRAIGIQCHWSYHSEGAFTLARWLKELDPSLHVTLGGVHASALAGAILRDVPHVDAVVVGEAEAAYPALLRTLEGPRTPVPGVAQRFEDGTVETDVRAAPPASEAVPALSFDPELVWPKGRGRYVGLPFMRGRCPKPCTFCSLNSTTLYPTRQVSLLDQLAEQLPAMIARRIPLYLPENYAGPKPLEALADALDVTGPAGAVLVDVHPGMLNDRAVQALVRVRDKCERLRLWLGVESGSEAVRRRAGRSITDEALLSAFERVAAAGIETVQSSVMVGLPGEGPAEVAASDALIARLNERGVLANVLPVVAFPETALFAKAGAFGLELGMRGVRDFDRLSRGWHAPIATEHLSCWSASLPASDKVEATLKLRLRQRERLGYRVTPELFRTMEHLPGLRRPGESERLVEHFAPLLSSPAFGGPVRPSRFWEPDA